jgi:predicted RNase H-like nuclease
MSNVANRQVTDSDIESWALSAVGAIERFIAERNALRERVRAQDRELSLLREHVSLMRNSYRRLANEFVTQLEIVDNLVPETTQLHERQKPTESSQLELSKTRVA